MSTRRISTVLQFYCDIPWGMTFCTAAHPCACTLPSGHDPPVMQTATCASMITRFLAFFLHAEGKDMGATLAYSGEQRFRAMEGEM